MRPLTVLVPYYKGQYYLPKLLTSLPAELPVIVIDDQSPGGVPPLNKWPNARAVGTRERGYFGGAVNCGFEEVPEGHDVLVLNQDVRFTGDGWLHQLRTQLESAGLVGDFVKPNHIHTKGYVQGTFMGIRADVREKLGDFDADEYPHWGVTCLYQLRACRQGFKAEPLKNLDKWMIHERDKGRGQRRYGSATREMLARARPGERERLIKTPVALSVVVPVYNKAEFVADAVRSVLNSRYQDFEIVLVEDASTDNSREVVRSLVDPWKLIRAIYHETNKGVVASRNDGVRVASGDLIFQLDADDMVANKGTQGLARMVNAFRADPTRWVYSDLHVFGEVEQEQTRRFRDFDSPHPYFIAENNVAQASILYPKEWWEEVGGYHPESERGHDDWCFAIALTAAGHCGQRLQSVDGDPLPAVLYREVKGSRNKTSRRRGGELREMKRRLWPKVFKGYRERVDMAGCCGGGRASTRRRRAPAPAQPRLRPDSETMEVIYIGKATAAFPKRGRSTGTRYAVRPGQKLKIYAADKKDFLSGKMAREYRQVNSPARPKPEPVAAPKVNGPPPKRLNTMAPSPEPQAQDGVSNPSDMKVTEAKAIIASLSIEALREFRAKEANGKGRVRLLGVIDKVLAEHEELVPA